MTPADAVGTVPEDRPPRLFIVAGEHSGDNLGADLMHSLQTKVPSVRFEGVGGPRMIEAGLTTLFPMSDIAIMGIVPVIRRLPFLLRRIEETVQAVIAAAPDALIVVDSPGFTLRLARLVRKRAPGIPIVKYVSPSVWAWRSGRAPAMRRYIDHLLALLPFEPEVHRRLKGPPCTYVGHPLIERRGVLRPDAQERAMRGRPSLVVLPGSRRAEIAHLGAVFGDAVGRVFERLGPMEVVLPAVEDRLAEIEAAVAAWPVKPRIVRGEAAKLEAFRRARVALAASGTVTLELALAQVPMVVAYKVSPFEIWLKYVVKVPSIVLPNLILGQNAVSEFIQGRCTAANLEGALLPLFEDGPQRSAQLVAFDRLDALMRLPGDRPPSSRAAEVVLSVLNLERRRKYPSG